MKKIISFLLKFFRKKKLSKNLDNDINILSDKIYDRNQKREDIQKKVIKHIQSRIRPSRSAYITPKKTSHCALMSECKNKYKKDLDSCDASLSGFKVKGKKII